MVQVILYPLSEENDADCTTTYTSSWRVRTGTSQTSKLFAELDDMRSDAPLEPLVETMPRAAIILKESVAGPLATYSTRPMPDGKKEAGIR
jgi:hypothetical protein